jgi:hypothetical protein
MKIFAVEYVHHTSISEDAVMSQNTAHAYSKVYTVKIIRNVI